MTLTVTAAATDTALTTLPTIKNELNITNTTDDAFLVDLIKQASAAIVTYCDRVFAKQTYLETQVGTNKIKLVLSQIPVVSISSILFNNTTIATSSYDLDKETGVLNRAVGWPSSDRSFSNIVPHPSGEGREYLKITYVAGYDTPGSTATSTLPSDIERACIDLVKFWHDRRYNNPAVRSQRIGDASETLFEMTSAGIPKNIAAMLDRYVSSNVF